MSVIQPRLQYNYATIDIVTGECIGAGTYSYQVNHPAYIQIPTYTDDYVGKYYKDGMFYWDSEFTRLWEECPSHNV